MTSHRTKGFMGLGLLAAAAACSSAEPVDDDTDDVTSPIQAGSSDRFDPAVGVVHFTSSSFCSATLIASDIVLTAGHCADASNRIDAFYTGTGKPSLSYATDPGTLGMVKHEVLAQATYPGFDRFRECPNLALDIALVQLKEPIKGIRPARFGGPPTIGAACRGVGFGSHRNEAGATEYFEKRAATAQVTAVRETSFDVKAGTGLADHGDSGGPLFCGNVIVGTTSCHTDGDWPTHQVETYGNVAAGLPWIRAMVARFDPRTQANGLLPGADGGVSDASAASDASDASMADGAPRDGAADAKHD